MGEPSYGNWHQRAFCECGHDLGKASFGNVWFVQQDYPVCPSCGGSKYGYKLKTVRSVSRGWFKHSTFEELPEGTTHSRQINTEGIMLDQREIQFKATIKNGTAIFHDHGFYRWPDCAAPTGHKANPQMIFTATMRGDDVSLRAPGFGELPGAYGNGSIHVKGIDGIEIADETDKQKIIDMMVRRRQSAVDRLFTDAHKIQRDIDHLKGVR